jgi:hypothetical protein
VEARAIEQEGRVGKHSRGMQAKPRSPAQTVFIAPTVDKGVTKHADGPHPEVGQFVDLEKI